MNNKKPNSSRDLIKSPLKIDKIRIAEAYISSLEENSLIKKALEKYAKDLDKITPNNKKELIFGDYTHKLIYPNLPEVASRFKAFRTSIGLTQKQMALLVSSSQQSIYQIENANAVPSIVWAVNMVHYFDMNIHWFLTGESTMFTGRSILEEKFNALTRENEKLKKDLKRKNIMLDKLFE